MLTINTYIIKLRKYKIIYNQYMSIIRSIFYNTKFGSKRAKKSNLKAMVNTLLLKTKKLGSIRFFLDGRIVVGDNRAFQNGISKRELSLLSAAVASSSLYNSIEEIYHESRKDVAKDTEYPVSLNNELMKSLKRLKEKVLKLTNKYPNIPKPNINSFWDGSKCYIDIPLLCNCPNFLQGKNVNNGSIYITIDEHDILDQVKVVLEKSQIIEESDLDLLMETYEHSFQLSTPNFKIPQNNIGRVFNKSIAWNSVLKFDKNNKAITDLESSGWVVYQPNPNVTNLDWDALAGYDKIKRTLEDSVLFTLTHQDVFQQITELTRDKADYNKPRCILFEGPPGWGKTTTARIMSQTVGIPLVYLPLEAVLSKYYGESETKLAKIFESWQEFKDCILFIDEVDSLATSRDSGIHEASRRLLSTLLRKIDSFETQSNVLVILFLLNMNKFCIYLK